MVEFLSVEPFNWLDQPKASVIHVVKDIENLLGNAVKPGGLSLTAHSLASYMYIIAKSTQSAVLPYSEAAWVFNNTDTNSRAVYGSASFQAIAPAYSYRKFKTACGMNMRRSSTTNSIPVMVWIEGGQWGTGYYGVSTSESNVYVEVVIDWQAGSVAIFFNNIEVAQYTFSKNTDASGNVTNNVFAEFGNNYTDILLSSSGVVSNYSFWVYSNAYWYPSSYYMTYSTSAEDNPRLGKIRVLCPEVTLPTLTHVDISPVGNATLPLLSSNLMLPQAYPTGQSPSSNHYVTTSSRSSLECNALNTDTDTLSVIATGVRFMGLLEDAAIPSKVRINIDDAGSNILTREIDVGVDYNRYKDVVVPVAGKVSTDLTSLKYSMTMA